jgi:proteasome assembly chaperone (PAC2) family protein
MGIRLFENPKLKKPELIAGWPGIANIGMLAVNTLITQLQAAKLAEVEPWDFFYPQRVSIGDGLLKDLQFPASSFYYQRLKDKDIVLFIGERQPTEGEGAYSKGVKAWQMANQVLDVALQFGCRRVYTSGACVSLIHHEMRPRVCAVGGSEQLVREVKKYQNTILMSEMAGRESEGVISGLNGLLLSVAKKRGLEGLCLMGEIPDWLSQVPQPYPRASKSVLEVLAEILGIEIDFSDLDEIDSQVENVIQTIYEKFPPELKEKYDERKLIVPAELGGITEEDARWLKEHVNELFKEKRDEEDGGNPV